MFKKLQVALLAGSLAVAGPVLAVAPAWVEPAFTAGQGQLTDIIAEIAPYALIVVALMVGFRLVIKIFRNTAS